MAEGVFRSLTSESPLISKIDSCGTAAYHVGAAPDPRTMATLEEHGISTYVHKGRKFQPEDFKRFDYILGMDRMNKTDLEDVRRAAVKRFGSDEDFGVLKLFGDFGGKPGEQVVDPYYGGNDGFEAAYHQMVRFTEGLMKEIEGK